VPSHACSIDFEAIMSSSHWITVAVAALMPLAATAQQTQQFNPAEADAPIPTAGYVSAFEGYRTTPDEQVSPGKAWRAANEAVKSNDAHAGHGSMPPMGAAASVPKAGNPAADTPGAMAPKSDPHAGHHATQGK
jgi:hypothetical protein